MATLSTAKTPLPPLGPRMASPCVSSFQNGTENLGMNEESASHLCKQGNTVRRTKISHGRAQASFRKSRCTVDHLPREPERGNWLKLQQEVYITVKKKKRSTHSKLSLITLLWFWEDVCFGPRLPGDSLWHIPLAWAPSTGL